MESMTPQELLAQIKGIPLVHSHSDANKILFTMTELRAHGHMFEENNFNLCFPPGTAEDAGEDTGSGLRDFLGTIECDGPYLGMLKAAVESILSACPEWERYLSIPIEYEVRKNGLAGLTNRLTQRHVQLGQVTIYSPIKMEEVLIYDVSQVWCGSIAEICDLQSGECPKDFSLPSGTRGKNVREVILAALFAASSLKYYLNMHARLPNLEDVRRARYLHDYLDQCLNSIVGNAYVSAMGRLIIADLRIFSDQKMLSVAKRDEPRVGWLGMFPNRNFR
jgi:hypothetical protein